MSKSASRLALVAAKKKARRECKIREVEQALCALSPLDVSREAKGVVKKLLEIDWLYTNFRDEKDVLFGHLVEQAIPFLPTYRVSKQTTTRYDLAKKRHGRYPGYADRILHSRSLNRVANAYRSWAVVGSDHLPVSIDFAVWGTTVRVVTYNCGGKDRALMNFWETLVVPNIGVSYILCLQELQRPKSRYSLVPQLVSRLFDSEVYVRCNDRIPVVQPLLSDFSQAIVALTPKGSASTLRVEHVSACRSSNLLATKGWMHADIHGAPSEVPIRVYCMHAPFVDEDATRRFFAALEDDLARFRKRSYGAVPVVVAGDLNSRSVPIGLAYAKNVRRCFATCTPAKPR